MDPVITRIREDLKDHADPAFQQKARHFFREEIACYGIKTAAVVAIAKKVPERGKIPR